MRTSSRVGRRVARARRVGGGDESPAPTEATLGTDDPSEVELTSAWKLFCSRVGYPTTTGVTTSLLEELIALGLDVELACTMIRKAVRSNMDQAEKQLGEMLERSAKKVQERK